MLKKVLFACIFVLFVPALLIGIRHYIREFPSVSFDGITWERKAIWEGRISFYEQIRARNGEVLIDKASFIELWGKYPYLHGSVTFTNGVFSDFLIDIRTYEIWMGRTSSGEDMKGHMAANREPFVPLAYLKYNPERLKQLKKALRPD